MTDQTSPKGYYDYDLVEQYLDEHGKLFTADDIEYLYGPEVIGQVRAHEALVCQLKSTNKSLCDLGQCACLDVGCWTGNRDGPLEDPTEAEHVRHREFGVVSGNVAVLCSYPSKRTYTGKATVSKVVRKNLNDSGGFELFNSRILPVLNHLSSSNDSKKGLGDVEVVNALAVTNPKLAGGRRPEDDPYVHVFIGDFHLPVMTDPRRRNLKPGAVSPKDPAAEVKAAGTNDNRIMRAGRLDLSDEVIERARHLVDTLSNKPTVESFLLPNAFLVLPKIAYDIAYILYHETIWNWRDESQRQMTEREASEWFIYYGGGTKKKGADIFQGAADDMEVFLDLLIAYGRKKKGVLRLVQLGDFFDLWIGLKCGFGKKASLNTGVQDFVKTWVDETREYSYASKVVKKFDAIRENEQGYLDLTIVHGNHDNYLKGRHNKREELYSPDESFVFAEHGHQYDGFNGDEDPRMGWAITQAAFIAPIVRKYEDLATKIIALSGNATGLTSDPSTRLVRFARGGDVCYENKKLIYVLAHTHRPMLRRMTLRPEFMQLKAIRERVAADRTRVHILALAAQALADAYAKEAALFDKKKKEALAYGGRKAAEGGAFVVRHGVELYEFLGVKVRETQTALQMAGRGLELLGNEAAAVSEKVSGMAKAKLTAVIHEGLDGARSALKKTGEVLKQVNDAFRSERDASDGLGP